MPIAGSNADRVRLILGDCRRELLRLDQGSVDAIVTDPPGAIAFMGKEWDTFGRKGNGNAERDRAAANMGPGAFLGNQPFGYSGSAVSDPGARDAFVEMLSEAMRFARRLLRSGGYALVWAIPRTSHWTAWALEEAGFEIKDRVNHIFGTGFPKGDGSLKPACEDWWLCRKPGKGMTPLNIDACRIGVEQVGWSGANGFKNTHEASRSGGLGSGDPRPVSGRWPANLVLSHHPECVQTGTRRVNGSKPRERTGSRVRQSGFALTDGGGGHADADGKEEVESWTCHPDCPVRLLDEQAGRKENGSGVMIVSAGSKSGDGTWTSAGGMHKKGSTNVGVRDFGDCGGPSRFFYVAKPSRAERDLGCDGLENRQLVRMRDDLTSEKRAWVLEELRKAGVSF